MVMRYFGSKEGLFAAAATFDLHLPDLTAVPVRQRGERLAQNFVDLWGRERMEGGLPILLRTAATNDSAAGRILKIFHEQVLPTDAVVAPDAAAKRSALLPASFSASRIAATWCGFPSWQSLMMKLSFPPSAKRSSAIRTIRSAKPDSLNAYQAPT